MLSEKQQETYGAFFTSTKDNGILDKKTTHMIQMASAMILGCYP